MAPMVSVIEVARPPAEVFSYVTDPTHFPEWQKDVVSVSMSGSRFVTTRRIGGVDRVIVQEGRPQRPATKLGRQRRRRADPPQRGVALLPLVRRQTRKGSPKSYANLKRLLE